LVGPFLTTRMHSNSQAEMTDRAINNQKNEDLTRH